MIRPANELYNRWFALRVLWLERSELVLAKFTGFSSSSVSFANLELTNATHERSKMEKQTTRTQVLNIK